jgi:hypothetical protein
MARNSNRPTAQSTVRLHASSWITPIRFTEGEGFTGNDTLTVRHLNAMATEKNVTTMDAALALARMEYAGVVEIAEDPIADVPAPVVDEAPAITQIDLL